MSKRGHHEGTIYQRASGVWVAAMSIEGGRRKSWTGKTRQEVARKLNEALRDRDRGLPVVAGAAAQQTVAQWATAWLEMIRPPKVGTSTHQRYSELLRLHVVPAVGKVAVAKLTPAQVQRLYSDVLAAGCSSSTARRVHGVLHACLQSALRLGLVARNVTDLVERPRDADHEIHPLTEEQVDHLLTTADVAGDRLRTLYLVALTTGMRQGELLALKWRDVDLGDGSLQVRASLRWQDGQYVYRRPKTAKSRRRIALAASVVEALRAHRLRQLKEARELGAAWTDKDLVFPNEVGCEQDAGGLRGRFKRLLRTAGLPDVRFHDLRHTCATLLLGRRVNPKVVSEMLGHASIAITLDIYSHVLPDMQSDAAAVMERILSKRETD